MTEVVASFAKRADAERDRVAQDHGLRRFGRQVRHHDDIDADAYDDTAEHDDASEGVKGAAGGAMGGAAVGAGAGLLASAGKLLVPGIGPFLAAGTLAGTLGATAAGAAGGAVIGGVAGALFKPSRIRSVVPAPSLGATCGPTRWP